MMKIDKVTDIETDEIPYELPKGWVRTKLRDITENIQNVKPNVEPNKEFIYLDIASIDNSQQRIVEPKIYLGKDAPSRARQLIKAGDILFSTVRTYLKNIAMVNEIYNGQIASTGFCVIRSANLVTNRLIFYLTQTDFFLNPLNQIQRGTSYPAIRDSDVFDQVISLPPLAEQHRIVAKIEELFTKLDASIESLKKVQAQLKQYRQAVLKSAVEGKLTAEWRAIHKDELEPASVLLERIRKEKNKDSKYALIDDDKQDMMADLPDLPDGWGWAKIGEIGEIITGTTPSKLKMEYYGNDLPFYKPTDLNEGYYVRKSRDGLSKEGAKEARLIPEKSILVTCIGATIGKTGFIRTEGAFNQQINAIIPSSHINQEFIYFSCISDQFQRQILNNASATTLPILNKGKFVVLYTPIPPISEQKKIIEEIELRLSIADKVEIIINAEIKRAERLRQSILKQAFSGRLVPQDPNDEPASVLLDRIKQEKAKNDNHGKGQKTMVIQNR
jgi:type I restriction enzyme, S subunit